MTDLIQMGRLAKSAARVLLGSGAEKRNAALFAIAQGLVDHTQEILAANKEDVAKARATGLTEALIDRLTLDAQRIADMAQGVTSIAKQAEVLGKSEGFTRPNGLKIQKIRVPLGVIGIIYESRPNVTVDAAALCLKAGNAVILRGGKEALHSSRCLVEIMRHALLKANLPQDAIALVDDPSRETARDLMRLHEYIDVLIPRGGAGLIRAVVENATIPVIETGVGNCHVFVDESASMEMAQNIVLNAKTSRPSVCNALETLLVHERIAQDFLLRMKDCLLDKNVEIRGCETTVRIFGEGVIPATDDDYFTEYNDYILAVRVVENLDAALEHIAKYSSGHSDCIITEDYANALRFGNEVDSAAVYVNASTRFTDGGEFGFGAEIGISTQKLHARGPMGLMELTSHKYLIHGSGQIRP